MNQTITITEKEYKQLLKDSHFLECLKAAGVDNWDGGYSEARKMHQEDYPEDFE